MNIRRATVLDVSGIADVAAIVDPMPDGEDVDLNYYTYLAEHGRLVVAETSAIVIGYAGAIDVAGTRHLSDLFVHPDAHGRGIGSALLEAVWDSDASAVPRQTFASLHPAALPLYIRSGMIPRWPLLYLSGAPDALPPTHLRVRRLELADAVELETSWLGSARQGEYDYLSTIRGARTFSVLDGPTEVAVGVVTRRRRSHTLQRLVAADGSLMPDAVSAVAGWVGDDLALGIPGANGAVPMLVEAGWRVVEHDLYCASEPDLIDAARLLPHPGLL